MRIPAATVASELSSSVAQLIGGQLENGSIGDDVLTSAIGMRGLLLANEVIQNDRLERSSDMIYGYLTHWLSKTAADIRNQKEVYSGLPLLMAQTGAVIFSVWSSAAITEDGVVRIIRESLTALFASCHKYLGSLNNPVAVASLLLSLEAFQPTELSEIEIVSDLVDYSINGIVAKSLPVSDRSGILMALTELYTKSGKSTTQLLQAAWRKISQKMQGKNLPEDLKRALLQSASSLSDQILKEGADIISILRCLRTVVVLDPEDKQDLQGSLYEKISASTLPQIQDKQGNEKAPYGESDIVAAYSALALASSKFAKTVTFSSADEKQVKQAIRSYEEFSTKKAVLLARKGVAIILAIFILSVSFFVAPLVYPGLLSIRDYDYLGLLVTIVGFFVVIVQYAFAKVK